MSGSDSLHVMNKTDLECAICLNRFRQPKTLKCMHTYCLQCIEKNIESQGKMKCPKCAERDIMEEDFKQLESNTTVCRLLEYVVKTEEQKPSKCSGCCKQPVYHCSDCQLYICHECIKHHTIIPSLRNHSLYKLDIREQSDSCHRQAMCHNHCNTAVEFYCSTCSRTACKRCEHILRCYQNQHQVIPISTAVDEFNDDVTAAATSAQEIESNLLEHLKDLEKERSLFGPKLNLCKTAVEMQQRTLIMEIREKGQNLLSDLERIYKDQTDSIDSQVKHLDSKLTLVKSLMTSIDKFMNKPEETKLLDNLGSHKTTVTAIKDKLGTEFETLFPIRHITQNFIPSEHLADVISSEGIGKITRSDNMFEISKNDESITVTKGQVFIVNVSSRVESDASQLTARLKNFAGEESTTEVEYQGSGEYKIRGRCDVEGDWKMEIINGFAHVEGSPVDIKVETLGLTQTINISNYEDHTNNQETVSNVELATDGCVLVSNFSNTIFKFRQSGSFDGKIQLPKNVRVNCMYQMADGHMVYSDDLGKCVVMCDDKFNEIRSFGKGIFKNPMGLIVNQGTRVMYVTDFEAHCVFKFNVDDGSLAGVVRSQIVKTPTDITLTKNGHIIVVDNEKVLMFDSNDNFMKVMISSGKGDGKVFSPWDITIDTDENMLVSSNHKVQLFDKNGVFLRRIDVKYDGIDTPYSICIISNRPRRVAVANHGANNVKIFNY